MKNRGQESIVKGRKIYYIGVRNIGFTATAWKGQGQWVSGRLEPPTPKAMHEEGQ
jgi:hypothetical protein